MVVYDSADIFIETAKSLKDKIIKIDLVLDALMGTALKSAANANISEYWLDDGQTKIKTVYTSTTSVMQSIKSFETIKQMYINQLNGRVVRLVDSKNFTRNYGGR